MLLPLETAMTPSALIKGFGVTVAVAFPLASAVTGVAAPPLKLYW